ncbi:MAG TPA: hypothetical protein VLX85_01135 [Stellaceae bacterium]|nr:hypothetical protein [Stellaceae bacterium]
MAPVFPLDIRRMPAPGARQIAPAMIGKTAAADDDMADLLRERRRRRIWEIDSNFHCSIVGTYLSTAELRQLLIRLKLPGAETAWTMSCTARACCWRAAAIPPPSS